MNVGCNWWLNNKELVGPNTRVIVTAANLQTAGNRQSVTDLHTRGQFRERIGTSIPIKHLEISLLTTGGGIAAKADKWNLLAEILSVLENDEVWTLQAPDNYFVFKNVRRAAFSTMGQPKQDDDRGINKITLQLDAFVNGVWVADGGGYCENVSGYFQVVDGIMHLNDQVNPGGNGTRLVLPKQASGYPIAMKPDFSTGIPPILATGIIDGLPYDTYDMFDYVTPAPPVTDGLAHLFSVCQSPNIEFLDGVTDSGSPTGTGDGGIGSFPVAEQSVSD